VHGFSFDSRVYSGLVLPTSLCEILCDGPELFAISIIYTVKYFQSFSYLHLYITSLILVCPIPATEETSHYVDMGLSVRASDLLWSHVFSFYNFGLS